MTRTRFCATATVALAMLQFAPLARGATIYQQSVLADNPVAYWSFDEPTSTTTATNLASTGAAYNGTYINVTREQSAAFSSLGTAASFNGSNSRVQVANFISTWLNGTASLEFWLKTTQSGAPGWGVPSVTGRDQGGNPFDVFWGINDGGRVGIQRGNPNDELLVTPTPVNDNVWRHFVVTRDKPTGMMQVFVNGNSTPVATLNGQDNIDIAVNYNLLGRNESSPAGSFLLGSLDEIAIYNYVLSGDQVSAHYQAAVNSVPEPSTLLLGLVGLAGCCLLATKNRRRQIA